MTDAVETSDLGRIQGSKCGIGQVEVETQISFFILYII